MAVDIKQIRDEFVALAEKNGCRVEEQAPTKGYTFSANIYVGSERVGRLVMRKTTVSWKATGATKLQRLNNKNDVERIANTLAKRPEEGRPPPREPPLPQGKGPAAPARPARRRGC